MCNFINELRTHFQKQNYDTYIYIHFPYYIQTILITKQVIVWLVLPKIYQQLNNNVDNNFDKNKDKLK